MDTSTHSIDDKKWFVYISDHHEGPFTVNEIKQKVAQGHVSVDGYIWAEGMADWQPMSQVPAFSGPPASARGPSATPPSGPAKARSEQNDGPTLTSTRVTPVSAGPVSPQPSSVSPMAIEPTRSEPQLDATRIDMKNASSAPPVTLVAASRVGEEPKVTLERATPKAPTPSLGASKKRTGMGFKILLLMMFLLVGGIAAGTLGFLDPVLKDPAIQSILQPVTESARPVLAKIPGLSQIISPIPKIEDVTPEDYEELKAAASQEQGRLAVALSKADLLSPSFYVSSRLPEGARFDIWVEGISDTLLNQLSFSSQMTVELKERLGKTEALRSSDGKPIPRGEYFVYVTESETQPEAVRSVLNSLPAAEIAVPAGQQQKFAGRKLFLTKTLFLGGPRDQTYVARLQEFHERIKAKASSEMTELKQFSVLLESQIEESVNTFTQLTKNTKPTKPQLISRMKSWDEFHGKWTQMQEQVNQVLGKVTPGALADEYFYGPLYQLSQQTAQEANKLHELHHAFFKSTPEVTAFEIQVGEATSRARAALMTLKARLDQVDKQPATGSGLPQRMPFPENQP